MCDTCDVVGSAKHETVAVEATRPFLVALLKTGGTHFSCEYTVLDLNVALFSTTLDKIAAPASPLALSASICLRDGTP
jgi:hypothetical protein